MMNLLPVCYWNEHLDMVFFFKCVRGMVNINAKVLPELQSREELQDQLMTVQDINVPEFVYHPINKGVEHTSEEVN